MMMYYEYSIPYSLIHCTVCLQTVDARTGKALLELRPGRPLAPAVTALRFNPQKENEVWATTSNGEVYAGNTVEGESNLMLTGIDSAPELHLI